MATAIVLLVMASTTVTWIVPVSTPAMAENANPMMAKPAAKRPPVARATVSMRSAAITNVRSVRHATEQVRKGPAPTPPTQRQKTPVRPISVMALCQSAPAIAAPQVTAPVEATVPLG